MMDTTKEWLDDWLEGPVVYLAAATQQQYRKLSEDLPTMFPKIEDLKHREIRRAFKAMRSTPVKANRWKAVLSSFCAYLMEEEQLEFNPALGIKKYPEKPVERSMDDTALRDLAGGLAHCGISPATAAAIRIMLATGTRVSEAVGIRWEELSEADGGMLEWTIPRERTKPNRTLVTFIPASLAAELKELAPLRERKGRVLSTGGNSFLGDDTVRRALRRICVTMKMDHYSPHDIRRTVGTVLAKEGISIDVRKAILNHAPTGVTDLVYNRYDYYKDKQQALALLESKLRPLGVFETAGI